MAIFPLLSFSSIEHLYSLLIIFLSSRKGSLSSPRNSPRHATSVQVDYFDKKEDELKEEDVNRVAPNSDIIDIHYSHTSNANGVNKGINEPSTEVYS